MQMILITQLGLLFVGLLTVVWAVTINNLVVVAAGHVFLCLAGMVHLWIVIAYRTRYWSLCDIHAGSLLISYFGGSAMTLSLSEGGFINSLTIAQVATISDATLFIVLFAICLYAFGRLEAPLWRRLFDQGLGSDWPGWVCVVILSLGGLQAALLMSGAITFQGTGTQEGDELPVLASLVVALSWPLMGICGWILGQPLLRKRRLFLWSALALLPIELAFSFAHGRRVILFQALIFVTCFAWSRGRGLRVSQLFTMGVAALPVIYFLWVIFLALRIEGYSHTGGGPDTRDILTRLESASELMDSRWGSVAQSQEKEVVDRVFVLGYLVDLMDNARITNQYFVRVALAEFLIGVPRFLLSDKDKILASLKASEVDVGLRYKIGVADRAGSIVTASYIDFRWLGPPLYAAFAFLVGASMALLALTIRMNFFSVYVISYVFLGALATEKAFFAHNLNMMRLIFIVFVMLCFFQFVARLLARPMPTSRQLKAT